MKEYDNDRLLSIYVESFDKIFHRVYDPSFLAKKELIFSFLDNITISKNHRNISKIIVSNLIDKGSGTAKLIFIDIRNVIKFKRHESVRYYCDIMVDHGLLLEYNLIHRFGKPSRYYMINVDFQI